MIDEVDIIVKFDPTTMEILGTIDVDPLKREGMDTSLFLRGDARPQTAPLGCV